MPVRPRSGQPQWTHGNRLVALTSYVGVCGTDYLSQDGVLYSNSRTRPSDIRDGMSHTLLVAERPASADNWYGWWYAGFGQTVNGVASGSPDMLLGALERNDDTNHDAADCPPGPYQFGPGKLDEQCSLFHYWSLHSGGGHFLMCDGSVHSLSYQIDATLIPALATRAGGEVASFE